MTAYYNEIDPHAAAWLRELIKNNLIAPGVVDERSIEDVTPQELEQYTQCHFFAGVGVWSYALRQSGWPDDKPVWTGSCPCQPFSSAGAGAGFADPRHLWPSFAWLIKQCNPAVVFGEQVASKAVEPWVDLVHADLEAMGYAFGAVPFPSAGVGAPHIRDRLYWVGHSGRQGLDKRIGQRSFSGKSPGAQTWKATERTGVHAVRLGDTNGESAGRNSGAAHAAQAQYGPIYSDSDGLGNAGGILATDEPAGPANGAWADADWLLCRDARWRPVEPGTFPLAYGSAARVGRLRGYGNAINAEAAKVFIQSYLDTL